MAGVLASPPELVISPSAYAGGRPRAALRRPRGQRTQTCECRRSLAASLWPVIDPQVPQEILAAPECQSDPPLEADQLAAQREARHGLTSSSVSRLHTLQVRMRNFRPLRIALSTRWSRAIRQAGPAQKRTTDNSGFRKSILLDRRDVLTGTAPVILLTVFDPFVVPVLFLALVTNAVDRTEPLDRAVDDAVAHVCHVPSLRFVRVERGLTSLSCKRRTGMRDTGRHQARKNPQADLDCRPSRSAAMTGGFQGTER